MAMRVASRAPQRSLVVLNGTSQSFARQFSCSRRQASSESEAVFGRSNTDTPTHRIRTAGLKAQPPSTHDNYRTIQHKEHVYRAATGTAEHPVDIMIKGRSRLFSPILLRDLCQCSLCVDSSTRQKHFATPEIPQNIQARDVQTDETHVHLTWTFDIPGLPADHTTSIPLQTLKNISRNGRPVQERKPASQSLWTAQEYTEQTHDFDYESYMNDDSVLLTALRQLENHGLMFITNVPESEQSVETVANRIGPLKTTFYGRTWDVRSVPEAKNVAYTSQNLGFHMDLMYMKQPPHLQLLHCIRSSAAGGASLFSDSYKAVDDMWKINRKFFGTLSRVPVTYHYDHTDHYYHQKRPVIEQKQFRFGSTQIKDFSEYVAFKSRPYNSGRLPDLSPMDFVEHVAWSPPFQGPFSLSSEGTARHGDPEGFLNNTVEAWHAAARKFNELIHRPECVYERMMKPGECVIFDNRRVLHARRAFEVGDAGKERWLRGAYIDKDPFMSKLKVMTDEQKHGKVDSVREPDEYFAAAAAS